MRRASREAVWKAVPGNEKGKPHSCVESRAREMRKQLKGEDGCNPELKLDRKWRTL